MKYVLALALSALLLLSGCSTATGGAQAQPKDTPDISKEIATEVSETITFNLDDFKEIVPNGTVSESSGSIGQEIHIKTEFLTESEPENWSEICDRLVSAQKDTFDSKITLYIETQSGDILATAFNGKLQYNRFAPESERAVTLDMILANATMGEKNAYDRALSYLSHAAFSYESLVEQLEFEKFSHSEAVFGADYCGADWYEQAAKRAKSYLSHSSFSKQGLIDQLVYEGFTEGQAIYGVEQNGY